ncbi:MAG: hypothetical protein AABX54_01430 [Nanoarchaeota archaeon]
MDKNNSKFEHYQFGTNVMVDIPSYQRNGDHRISGIDETKDGVMLRLFFRDRLCDVVIDECDFEKCKRCTAIQYNPMLPEHLCKDPSQCPAVNPRITIHQYFAKPGHRARLYPAQLKEDPNYV